VDNKTRIQLLKEEERLIEEERREARKADATQTPDSNLGTSLLMKVKFTQALTSYNK